MSGGWKAFGGSFALALVLVGTGIAPTPAEAQDDARLRRIESELRALQRVVFPDGDGRFFTPEVVTGEARPQPQVGLPSTTAVSDILARLDTLENQLARLTARSEETTNELSQLEERLAALEAAASAPPAPVGPVGVVPIPQTGSGSTSSSAAAAPPPAPAEAAPAPEPSPERLAAVRAIAKPSTDDAGDDEYVYGFRLWEAGYYPEAQQQLALFVERYPKHWRTTYGRNLLGRAFLDNGQPRDAATHLFENYQADRNAERAPDSLLFLAEAMIALNDTNRACIALAEFGETYPALATGRLKEQYDRNRARVTCS